MTTPMPAMNHKSQIMVVWAIWFSMLISPIVLQFVMGGGIPVGESEDSLPLPSSAIAAFLLLASLSLRWLVLARLRSFQLILPLLIVGMTLAEAAVLVEIFLIPQDFPTTRLVIALSALFIMLQYFPIYMFHIPPAQNSASTQKNPLSPGL